MVKQTHIFFSYAFDNQGLGHQLKNDEVANELKNKGLAWVHLDGNNYQSKKWLQREVSYLDHLIIDALFAEETRPRIIEFETGMLIILRGINLNNNSEVEDLASIRLWIDDERIISIQKRNFSAAFHVAKNIDQGRKIKDSGEFLYNLIYEILMLLLPLTVSLGEKMDDVEDKADENINQSDLREAVAELRRKTTVLRRYMKPQKEVLQQLKSSDNQWVGEWARRHFQENHDQVSHMLEELDEVKERAQIIHDELSNAITDNLNKSIFKISLIASIFMPLGFVAGLFGMNVGGIPGENNSWGFSTIVFAMTFILAASIFMLKKKKLF